MKTYGKPKTRNGEDKELRDYICPFCQYKFKQWVTTIGTEGKHSNVSDQVQCNNCGNFMKTWGD